jgi:hypothetical protein
MKHFYVCLKAFVLSGRIGHLAESVIQQFGGLVFSALSPVAGRQHGQVLSRRG